MRMMEVVLPVVVVMMRVMCCCCCCCWVMMCWPGGRVPGESTVIWYVFFSSTHWQMVVVYLLYWPQQLLNLLYCCWMLYDCYGCCQCSCYWSLHQRTPSHLHRHHHLSVPVAAVSAEQPSSHIPPCAYWHPTRSPVPVVSNFDSCCIGEALPLLVCLRWQSPTLLLLNRYCYWDCS